MTLVSLAAAAVRLWTRIYTWRMRPGVRERRRAEVGADLHDHIADSTGDGGLAGQLLWRLIAGAHHDVIWRLEAMEEVRPAAAFRLALMTATAAVAVSIWAWLALPVRPPDPPQAPRYRSRLEMRPMPVPPPPPPPLCVPPGIGREPISPCTTWP